LADGFKRKRLKCEKLRDDRQQITDAKSLEGPLLILLISSRSIEKHGRHRQFLFLIGSFLKKNSHLAERFQRRRLKCEKLTENGHQVMAKAHFDFGKVS
jgi:hypothetical protein